MFSPHLTGYEHQYSCPSMQWGGATSQYKVERSPRTSNKQQDKKLTAQRRFSCFALNQLKKQAISTMKTYVLSLLLVAMAYYFYAEALPAPEPAAEPILLSSLADPSRAKRQLQGNSPST
ncbi:uncharacterized protein LOC135218485 [Macrobrachium nipponense]|uniref:uncharacterized protein LOC135218485 n=1 Tax=Macrobrachium nipponense TaxID=159736 RepID=UPI0030C848A5